LELVLRFFRTMVVYQNQLFDFLRDPSLYISKELPIIRSHSPLSSSFSSFTFFSLSWLHLFKWICIATENYDSDFSLSLFGFPPVGQNWLIGMVFVNWLQIGPKVMTVCYESKFIIPPLTSALFFIFLVPKNTCFSKKISNFFLNNQKKLLRKHWAELWTKCLNGMTLYMVST
jgi:hypothetical protein